MATDSFYYVVPDMQMIPQDKDNGCWFASAKMVIRWKMNKYPISMLMDPDDVAYSTDLYRKDEGITDGRIAQLAKELGLRTIPPMSPNPKAMYDWITRYGPLWVNGIGHITVIAGINASKSDYSFLVYDPLPVDKGSIEWRDARQWYTGDYWPVAGGGLERSGRDTKTNAGIFLYAP
jgi:hypothetical protein